MHILKALNPSKNRVRFNFENAVHVIENLNITETMISAHIKSYASLDAYNYHDNPDQPVNINDGRAIMERHESFSRLALDLTNVLATDPYEMIKEASYNYIVENCEEYKGGIVND